MYFHFSEDKSISVFHPRLHPSDPSRGNMVWAISGEKSPLYFFPRDCPRIGFYAGPSTTEEDQTKFAGISKASLIITVEAAWYERIQAAKLYAYSFAPAPFVPVDENSGYYVSYNTVTPLSVEPMGDLITALVKANVELRLTPSLKPLRDALLDSTMCFSMIRLRNAKL
ncbi:hypothetical protein NDK47_12640 [Brevibacillus ruminantium]|uniref:Uncharacterized protein n=1 Tax=Brevibacillus ruminantium TaxID=2950604 RepID=A0ABY4WMT1_9BACL|nr:DUF6886 family protein [Brevibacillus ruminantium]USG68071.1 hypothetical protein NDK47_12640 [Brevibacillus ruminantium]